MPLFSLSLEPGSDTYPYQDPLYRSESCRRRLRKTAPCGSPGMATQDCQACRRRYWCFSISCRSTWQLSSVPSPPVQSEFHVPDDWRQANVAPIFKKGEKYDAANYRPVSLTCICCKTLEHIIVSNINKHLAFESILADCQHGFRSQRSCETQLVQFFHDLVSNLDRALNLITDRPT